MSSGEAPSSEGSHETDSWSENLAYGSDSESAIPGQKDVSEHWGRWYYGIYVGAVLLLVGAVKGSLALLLSGYLVVPIAIHLDSCYVESVVPTWQRDTGLYVLGSLLFPVVMVPIYLYRRRELRIPE